jgi:hypothetical protein
MDTSQDDCDGNSPPGDPEPADIELDGLRIRKIARMKQSAMRFSSYCFVGAAACGVGAGELIWRGVGGFLLEGLRPAPLICLMAAAALGWAGIRLLRKSRQLSREARQKGLAEPNVPPDFSSLSDGSHIAGNLERIE